MRYADKPTFISVSTLSSSVVTAIDVTRHSRPAKVVNNVDGMVAEMSSTDIMVAEELPASSHAPYMTTVGPRSNHENSSTIERLLKNIASTLKLNLQ